MTATWTTPKTWKALEQPPAADLNTYVSNNMEFLFRALQVAVYEDQKASGTDGGTATSGSWETRTLNTEVSDSGGIGSLASNQITLQAGKYFCVARCQGRQVSVHQVRIQDVTTPATLLLGANAQSAPTDAVTTDAWVIGTFTLSGAKAIELQHRVTTTVVNTGRGIAHSFGTEVYAQVLLWRIGE